MKRIVLIVSLLISAPAWAQEQSGLTPLQQYLFGESGYAPNAPQVAPAPLAQTYTPEEYAYVDQQQYAPATEEYAVQAAEPEASQTFFSDNN